MYTGLPPVPGCPCSCPCSCLCSCPCSCRCSCPLPLFLVRAGPLMVPSGLSGLSFMTVPPLLCAELLRGLAKMSVSIFHNPISRIPSESIPQLSRIQNFFILSAISARDNRHTGWRRGLLPVLPGTAACSPAGWRRESLASSARDHCLRSHWMAPGSLASSARDRCLRSHRMAPGSFVSCHFCQGPLPVIPPDGAGSLFRVS